MNYRKYTKRNLRSSFLSSFFSGLSITNWIIFINLIMYVFLIIALSINQNFLSYVALNPDNLFSGKYVWTLVTHMFSHVWFFHLFFNMFSLFFIGNFVEKIIGRKRFFWFYLIAGLIGGIFFSVLSFYFGSSFIGARLFGSPAISGVGASGAIFGLLGLLALLTPNAKVFLIVGPLVAIIIQSILSSFLPQGAVLNIIDLIVSIYFFVSLIAIFSFSPRFRKLAIPLEMPFWVLPFIAIIPLVLIGLFVELPIGNMAHLGGLIAGIIFGLYLRNRYKKKVYLLNRMIR